MVKIFISYARDDGSIIAKEFANRLRSLEHAVFLDIQGIPGGANWEKELTERIQWCDVLLVIVTHMSEKSEYVYNEVRLGIINEKVIVPIFVDEMPPPAYLRPYNGFMFSDDNYDSILLKLANATFPSVKKRLVASSLLRRKWATALIAVTLVVCLVGIIVLLLSAMKPQIDPDSVIAFTSLVDGDTDIWVMNADRSGLKNISRSPTSTDMDPSLSPDGSKVVFASDRDGDWDIYIINVDGTDLIPFTTNDVSDGSPVWSPDGTMIAWTSHSNGNDEIYIMRINETEPVNITNNPASDVSPTWSPDGGRIAFRSNRDGNSEIYVVTLGDSRVLRVTDDHNQGYTVDWSPDGKTLVYDSEYESNYDIFTIDLQSGKVVQLTFDPSNDAEPNYSPDGQFIIFVSERVGNKELFYMRSNGDDPQNAIFNISNDSTPDWK